MTTTAICVTTAVEVNTASLDDQCRIEWAPETIKEMLEAYERGNTLREIAKHWKVSYETVRRLFRILEVPLVKRGSAQRRFTDEEEAFFLSCQRRGMTITDLAALQQVTRETMSKSLRRARIKDQECPKKRISLSP